MAIMTDQNYKRIFIILSGLAIVLFVVLLISLTFDVSLQSKELWIGALIVFLTIFLYYTTPPYIKILTIITSAVVMYIFLNQFMGWSMQLSIIAAVITIILIIMGYFVVG
jgi:hypothetical protein